MSKDQAIYWRTKLKRREYKHHGETKTSDEWYIRVQFQARRNWIPLGTANKDIAAKTAVERWQTLLREGWAGLEKQKPQDPHVTTEELTVGSFLELAREPLTQLAQTRRGENMSAITFRTSVERLTKIVKWIEGIHSYAGKDYDKVKNEIAREQALNVPLSVITREQIERYKTAALKSRSSSTVRSDINSARSLFTPDVCRLAEIENPFAEVKKIPVNRKKQRYQSKFSLPMLLQKAECVARANPDFKPVYRCLVLAAGTGGRRGELDLMKWDDIDLETGMVEFRGEHLKTDTSEDKVEIVSSCLERLRQFRQESPNDVFILKGMGHAPDIGSLKKYRCGDLLSNLVKWLRSFTDEAGAQPFSTVNQPLHTIRKEVGSLIYEQSRNIHAAQQYLRHANVQTTIDHYVDPGIAKAPTIDF